MKSFKKTPAPAKATKPAAKPTKKPAPTEKQSQARTSLKEGERQLAKRSALPPSRVQVGASDDVQGEVDSSDIKLPYLALVQGVGDLSALFIPGQLVIAGEVELTDAPKKDGAAPTVNVVLVWAKKQFIEKLPYGSEEMPRIYDTSAAAEEDGLVTAWIDNEPPTAGPMLTCLALVEETEKAAEMESPLFSLEYDKRKFAPCLWRIKSTAYNRAGKAILTAKALSKKEPLYSRKFELSAKREKVGDNWIYTPLIRARGRHDSDFIEFVQANQGTSTSSEA